MNPFLGEVRIFFGNFAPNGWASCNGQLLPLAQNTALFSLLGTYYGGNGRTTFALPDLRGRAPLHRSENWPCLGEQTGMTTSRTFYPYLPTTLREIEPEAPKKKTKKKSAPKTDDSLGSFDPKGRALTELQRLADNLNETQEQVQQRIKSHAEIMNRILGAATHVREFQKKSIEGEFGDAGSSLKALLETIEALNQDPNALPELQEFIEKLTESQEQISQMIRVQEAVVNQIKYAAVSAGEYQTKLTRGALHDAGASLEGLMQTVNQLNELCDPDNNPWGLNMVSQQPQPTGHIKEGVSGRFLTVSFIIAMQGVFPPRG